MAILTEEIGRRNSVSGTRRLSVRLVAGRGETVEDQNRGNGHSRGAAEDKSIERGYATHGGVASVASSAHCSWKSANVRVAKPLLKRQEKVEGKVVRSRVLQIIFINHHHYRVLRCRGYLEKTPGTIQNNNALRFSW